METKQWKNNGKTVENQWKPNGKFGNHWKINEKHGRQDKGKSKGVSPGILQRSVS